ncbi:MAG: domain S-box-containing protein [Chitinophagaceae bacterium]|nr:domain S-box-containing protein [Chitinophagaceae bacterium]
MKNSEFDMFSFFEMTPDLVCIAGRDGFFRKVNHAVLEKLGYTEAELFASPISSFMHPEDRDHTARERTKLLDGTALVDFENRYVSKSGKTIWLHWTSVYIPDKEVVFAIAKDITQKKQIEKETEEKYKKFKGLATHFKNNIEKDRKNFAFELHEELAQLAAVIKMDIDIIKSKSPQLTDSTKRRIEDAASVAQSLIDKIRKLSFTISPNMLESLGLTETLQWLCKDFTAVNNIPCAFTGMYNEADLTYEIKLDIFRICQESLKNIMTHAKATYVDVIMEDIGNEICLSVIDNGAGFEMGKQKKTSGLTNMRTLATSINGELNINSETGKGTKVCFTIAKLLTGSNSPGQP